MKSTATTLLAITLLIPGAAHADTGSAGEANPRGMSAFAAALHGRIISCFEVEGGKAGKAERAALEAAMPDLLEELKGPEAPAQGDAAGAAAPDCLAHQSDTCAEPVASMSCDDLGKRLQTRLTALRLPPPAQWWAGRYATAVAEKILACLEEETGETPEDAQKEAVGRFQGKLGHALAREATKLECKAQTEPLNACVKTVDEISCSGLAIRIGTASGNLVRAMPSPCDAWLKCPEGKDAIAAVAGMLDKKTD